MWQWVTKLSCNHERAALSDQPSLKVVQAQQRPFDLAQVGFEGTSKFHEEFALWFLSP